MPNAEEHNIGSSHSEADTELSAGVTYTQTSHLGAIRVTEPASTATGLWNQLIDPWNGAGLASELVTVVQELLTGETPQEARNQVESVVGDALDGALVDLLVSLTRSQDDRWFWKALVALSRVGSGRPMGFRSSLEDIHAVIDLLAEGSHTPTVSIRLPDGFRERDSNTRQSWCRLIAALGQAVDVRLVCSGVEQAWLAQNHRDDLPSVSKQSDADLDEEAWAEALDVVSVGSRHARTLSMLINEDTESLTYSQLYSEFTVTRSRVRQVVAALDELGLVTTYGVERSRRVELTVAGRQFYEEKIAVQRRLGDCVSDTGRLCNNSRVSPRTHVEAGDSHQPSPASSDDRHRLPAHHETRYANRRTACASLGTGVEGGISVVDYPIDQQNDRAEGRWHYADGTLVVTAEGDNPMQLWSTFALALCDYRTFDQALTKQRLEEHDIIKMLSTGEEILRGMRNIGWLPEEVDTYADLRESLLDAGVALGKLTQKYANDDDNSLRGKITRDALGLAGALTQLLDLVGIDLNRVVKLPEFSRRFNGSRCNDLFESIAIGSTIGSRYNHHVPYRHLFETRPRKRQQAFEPTVDAANPVAPLIGSWTLVGDFAGKTDAVADALRTQFRQLKPHDDAPEIVVQTPVRTEPTRRQVAVTANEMLKSKGLRLTPEATSILHGLARTPFDVADALQRLAGDNEERQIDAAEVRYALAQLDPDRLLRGFDGRCTTPRNLVAALLTAPQPITGTELDDRADVSSRSRRDHLTDLIAIGLVEETNGRYRLSLSFTDVDGDDAERYTDRWPTLVASPDRPTIHIAAKVLRIGREHHGPKGKVESLGWPYTGVDDPPDLRRLSHPHVYLDTVLPELWGVYDHDEYKNDRGVVPPAEVVHVKAGPPVEQTAISDAVAEASP